MCGFIIAEPDFPGWWVWLYYLNPVSWLLYGGCWLLEPLWAGCQDQTLFMCRLCTS